MYHAAMVIASTSTFSNLSQEDIEKTRRFIEKERRHIKKMTPDEARRYLINIKVVSVEEAKRLGWDVVSKHQKTSNAK